MIHCSSGLMRELMFPAGRDPHPRILAVDMQLPTGPARVPTYITLSAYSDTVVSLERA